MRANGRNLKDENPIILITGHSKGAAVSNVLAHKLNAGKITGLENLKGNSGGDSENVYAYTFATPNVGTDLGTSYTNIFNILNQYDMVPNYPAPIPPIWNWEKHGSNGKVSMDSIKEKDNFTDSHPMVIYMNWMEKKLNEMNESEIEFTWTKLLISLPANE